MKSIYHGSVLADISASLQSPIIKLIYAIFSHPLEHLLGVRRLNHGYASIRARGGEVCDPLSFIRLVREELAVTMDPPDDRQIQALRRLQGPVVFVSNHPFGGLEALALVEILGSIRSDYRVLANFLLYRIPELRPILLPVDPYATSDAKRRNIVQLKRLLDYLKEGGMLAAFPAGEVSSFKIREGRIRDPAWNANLCRIIQRTDATVVPLYFHGRNSLFFQLIGFLHPYVRTLFLLREFVRPVVRRIQYVVGDPIFSRELSPFRNPTELAEHLRERTYSLSRKNPVP